MTDMYLSNCEWPVGLQQIALKMSGQTELPAPRPMDGDLLFLNMNALLQQFVVYKPAGRNKPAFRLAMAAHLEPNWDYREWKGFGLDFDGFVWQWPDGSILLALDSLFAGRVELVFRPSIGADGWYDTGDWLQDSAIVRQHQEFFKSKQWMPLLPLEVEEISKHFGDAWIDLMNPDYLRGFHQGYTQTVEDRRPPREPTDLERAGFRL